METENSCCVPRFPLIASCYKIVDFQTSFKLCLRSRSSKFWKGRSLTFYLRLRNPARKDWQGNSCWLHPKEYSPEVEQGSGGMIAFSILFDTVLVRSQHNCLRLLKTVKYFES